MQTFVQLTLLRDMYDDAAWQANVAGSGVANSYGLHEDEEGGYATAELDADTLQIVQADVCAFMGSAHEQERFYNVNVSVYKDAAGTLYVTEFDADTAFC